MLRKLDLDLSDEVIRALANCKPKVVEKVLMLLRLQIDKNLQRQGRSRLEIDANFAQSMDTKETKKSQSAPAAENSRKSSVSMCGSFPSTCSAGIRLPFPSSENLHLYEIKLTLHYY